MPDFRIDTECVGGEQQPTPARAAGGRGMSGEVIAVDVYNLSVGGVAMTVRARSSDAKHVPCVIVSLSAPQTQERTDAESQSRCVTRSTSLPVKEY